MGANLVTITMDVQTAAASRVTLHARLVSVQKSLAQSPPSRRLTVAEFEALPPEEIPFDLRTVLEEQLSNAMSAFSKALDHG